jgi:Kinetochore protein Mis14 like
LKLPSDTSSAAKDADDSEERYEPYDPRLANQLRDLYAQLETETTKVAELRRDAPAKAAQTYLENLKEEMALREKEVEERRKAVREGTKESERKTGLEGIEVKRQDKVQRAWDDAHGDLERLRGVTEAVAVLERAKTAATEVGVL